MSRFSRIPAAAVMLLLPAVLFVLSLHVGSYPLSFADIVHSVGELFCAPEEQAMSTRVFWNLRFARTLTAFLTGAVLGLCGGVPTKKDGTTSPPLKPAASVTAVNTILRKKAAGWAKTPSSTAAVMTSIPAPL